MRISSFINNCIKVLPAHLTPRISQFSSSSTTFAFAYEVVIGNTPEISRSSNDFQSANVWWCNCSNFRPKQTWDFFRYIYAYAYLTSIMSPNAKQSCLKILQWSYKQKIVIMEKCAPFDTFRFALSSSQRERRKFVVKLLYAGCFHNREMEVRERGMVWGYKCLIPYAIAALCWIFISRPQTLFPPIQSKKLYP